MTLAALVEQLGTADGEICVDDIEQIDAAVGILESTGTGTSQVEEELRAAARHLVESNTPVCGPLLKGEQRSRFFNVYLQVSVATPRTPPTSGGVPTEHYPDFPSFLDQATLSRDIRVYGFGEYHSYSNETPYKTTAEVFLEEVLPYLVKVKGVKRIGTEYLSVDANDEINWYIATGVPGPRLGSVLTTSRGADAKAWLDAFKRLHAEGYHVELRGVGITGAFAARYTGSHDDQVEGMKQVRNNAIRFIHEGLKAQDTMALFTGTWHNGLPGIIGPTTLEAHPTISYPVRLATVSGNFLDYFLPVDLVAPYDAVRYLRRGEEVEAHLCAESPERGLGVARVTSGRHTTYKVVIPQRERTTRLPAETSPAL